jgi:hypothetical protein
VTRKVITASKSDGAAESGLTALIWNQVLSYGADAMITVALAGTVFFGASTHAQRGNVLLYLLITMAPFAVVAPVIGPALDRLQHGRRWTMAGTAIVRAILALIMAAHSSDLLVLYPCALGSLVCSKAYAVVRAAAAPRLVPPTMTLTAANAKVTIFGLGSTLVLGGFVGALIKVSGSYSLGLVVTAIAFAACAVFSFKLPAQVDSATSSRPHPKEPPRRARQDRVPPLHRLLGWARRGFAAHLVVALQAEAAQRWLSGFLTIYLAFYVETTSQLRRDGARHAHDDGPAAADHHGRRRVGGGDVPARRGPVLRRYRGCRHAHRLDDERAEQGRAGRHDPARCARGVTVERFRAVRDLPAAGVGAGRHDRCGFAEQGHSRRHDCVRGRHRDSWRGRGSRRPSRPRDQPSAAGSRRGHPTPRDRRAAGGRLIGCAFSSRCRWTPNARPWRPRCPPARPCASP